MWLLSLTKEIPAHKKTVKFHWIQLDFCVMNEQWRKIRSKMSKPMDTCFWCNHKFIDGEMMALGNIFGNGNKVLCQTCAKEAQCQK